MFKIIINLPVVIPLNRIKVYVLILGKDKLTFSISKVPDTD